MSIKILTPGEKLRQIRNFYKIRQHEICGDYITRNMISMIETNKAGLTEKTAVILYENIKNLCIKKELDCTFTLDYLLTQPESEAKTIIIKLIENIKLNPSMIFESSFPTHVKEHTELMNSFNLRNEKISLYTTIGDIYLDRGNYEEAYTYLLRAADTCDGSYDNLFIFNLISKLISCCYELNNYSRVTNYWELIKDIEVESTDFLLDLLWNVFRSYKALKHFEEAQKILSRIDNIFSIVSDANSSLSKDYIMFQIDKALFLTESKNYVEALNIYNTLLNSVMIPMVYRVACLSNLCNIYLHLKDKKKLQLSLNKLLSLTKNNIVYDKDEVMEHLPNFYTIIANSFMYLKDYHSCFEYLQRALNVSKTLKDTDNIVKSMVSLFKVSLAMNHSEHIDEVKTLYLELISTELIPINNPVIFMLIQHYNDQNDSATISQLIEFSTSSSIDIF